MSNVVVVFSFPEPEDSVFLGLILEAAKKPFHNMSDMKIHMGINNVADQVISIFNPLRQEESNLVKHARSELALIGQSESDPEFTESIIKAVEGFSFYDHSGGSAGTAIEMLNTLLQFRNLSPLTNNSNEWIQHRKDCWQNRRNGEAFSTDGGKTYYLLSDGSTQNDQVKIYPTVTIVE